MRRRLAIRILAAGLIAAGCRRAGLGPKVTLPTVPRGDAIWLADPAGAAEPGLEAQLQRLGAVALFLPAGEMVFETGRWSLRSDPQPPHPFLQVPVVLVVRAGPELWSAFRNRGGETEAIARAVAARVSAAMGASGPYGRVVGVHLDFPLAPESEERYAQIIASLRRGLPKGALVSISLRFLPESPAALKRLGPPFKAADALVAFVFGAGQRVGPVATDALRRPWWAAYDPSAPGTATTADGRALGSVSESFIDRLSGDPSVDFENDLSVDDPGLSAFTFVARGPVRFEGLALGPEDRVAYRLPSLAEMLFQLGSTMAGKKFVLGRVIVFEGASEADRVFPIAALEDVVLGRTLSPVLDANVLAGGGALTVEAVNHTHQASIVSRVSNWVEVDLSPAHPADLQLGGFDRYEVYDASDRRVTPGLATRVRLFETLVAPEEAIFPARIVVRGTLPAACCRHRVHLMSASGREIASDWSSPPRPPMPAARKTSGRAKNE